MAWCGAGSAQEICRILESQLTLGVCSSQGLLKWCLKRKLRRYHWKRKSQTSGHGRRNDNEKGIVWFLLVLGSSLGIGVKS